MKECTNCRFMNPDGAELCESCGAVLTEKKKRGGLAFKFFNFAFLPVWCGFFLSALAQGNGPFFNALLMAFLAFLALDTFVLLHRTYQNGARASFWVRTVISAISILGGVLAGLFFLLADEWYNVNWAQSIFRDRWAVEELGTAIILWAAYLFLFATYSLGRFGAYRRARARLVRRAGGISPVGFSSFERARVVIFSLANVLVFLVLFLTSIGVDSEALVLPIIFVFALLSALHFSLDWVARCIYRKEPQTEQAGEIWKRRPLDLGNKILLCLVNAFLCLFFVILFLDLVIGVFSYSTFEVMLMISIIASATSFILLVGYNLLRWVLKDEPEKRALDGVVQIASPQAAEEDEASEEGAADPSDAQDSDLSPAPLVLDGFLAGHKPVLAEGCSLSGLYEKLCAKMPSADGTYVRGLLAAMASARLLVFADSSDPAANTFPAMAALFDAPFFHMPVARDAHSAPALVFDREPETGHRVYSSLSYACKMAEKYPDRVFFMGFSQIAESNLGVLSSLTPYLKKPYGKAVLFGTDGVDSSYDVLVVNENVWFLADAERNVPIRMERALAESCAVIAVRHGAQLPSLIEAEAPSLQHFLRMCEAAEDVKGLSEETWKKLDTLEDHLKANYGFAFDNKLLRAIEKYVAVYMALGGSEAEALDSVLAARVLPFVSRLKEDAASTAPAVSVEDAEAEEKVEEALSSVLARLFDLDKLPLCTDFLRLMNGRSDIEG